MEKYKATDLQPGWVVRLTDKDQLVRKNNSYFASESYLTPDTIARVTRKWVGSSCAYVSFETTVGEEVVTRYVEHAAAVFVREKDEQYLAERMDVFRKTPLIGSGQSIMIGSDPEVFVIDAKGTVIPAWKYLPGKPTRPNRNTQYAFWDGAQAEFTVIPATCHEQVGHSIRTGLRDVLEAARQHDKTCRLTAASVVDMSQSMLNEASDEHIALGCAPSLNAYPESEPIDVPEPRILSCRFAGCHIHMGYTDVPPERAIEIVKTMDAIFGVISVLMFQGLEDPRRRRFYGKAGEYRLPPHGIEYRVPSSALLCHPVAMHVAFDLARAASTMGNRGIGALWKRKSDEQVMNVINNYDLDEAKSIVKENDELLGRILHCLYGVRPPRYLSPMLKMARSMIYDGVKENLPTNEMEKVWKLTDFGESERNLYTYCYYDKV